MVHLQLNRKDREIENLFTAVQNTIDAKDTAVERCRVLSETNLPILKIKLDETLTLCENVLQRKPDSRLVSESIGWIFGSLSNADYSSLRRRRLNNWKGIVSNEQKHWIASQMT